MSDKQALLCCQVCTQRKTIVWEFCKVFSGTYVECLNSLGFICKLSDIMKPFLMCSENSYHLCLISIKCTMTVVWASLYLEQAFCKLSDNMKIWNHIFFICSRLIPSHNRSRRHQVCTHTNDSRLSILVISILFCSFKAYVLATLDLATSLQS